MSAAPTLTNASERTEILLLDVPKLPASEEEYEMVVGAQPADHVDMAEEEEEEEAFLSTQDLERVKEECRTNKHVKPPYSYIALITMAVLQVMTPVVS